MRNGRRVLAGALATMVAAVLVPALSQAPAHATAPAKLKLWTWYSPSRGDYYTTADPAWTDSTAVHSPDYRFVRNEGFVFDPHAPRPDSTVALTQWWHAGRADNMLTTNPSSPSGDGYSFVRVEGWVFSRGLAGTIELRSSWNPSVADNRASTDANMTGRAMGTNLAGWTTYRTEGYALPPSADWSGMPASRFGFGRLPRVGRRVLVTILLEYTDQRFDSNHTKAFYQGRVFGPSAPNVAGVYKDMSGARLSYEGAVVGPVTSRYSSTTVPTLYDDYRDAIQKAGALYDFHGADLNGDGTVQDNELDVLLIDAGTYPFNNGVTIGAGCVAASGINVCGTVSAAGEDSRLSNYLHELGHQTSSYDPYGSLCHSDYMGVMSTCTAGGQVDGIDPVFMDPYNRVQAGWVTPNVVPMSGPGSCQVVSAPGTTYNGRPTFFYDPALGPTRYFAVEYRNPSSSVNDRAVRDRGAVIWYQQTNADASLSTIPGVVVTAGPNGVLQSTRGGDDEIQGTSILPGPNRELNSTVGGDDVRLGDWPMFTLGSPNAIRGGSTAWRQEHGEFGLRPVMGSWLSPSGGLRMTIGPSTQYDNVVQVEWKRDLAFTPRLDSIAPDSALKAGWGIAIYGVLGVRSRDVTFQLRGSAGTFTLAQRSFMCSAATVAIPTNVPSGSYTLVARDSRNGTISNALPVTITS